MPKKTMTTLPSWFNSCTVNWDIPKWLPQEFHSLGGVKEMLRWAESAPYLAKSKLQHRSHLDDVTLALGLALRDASLASQLEDDDVPMDSMYLQNTKWSIPDLDVLTIHIKFMTVKLVSAAKVCPVSLNCQFFA
jgi:hypothetical protein